MKYDPLGQSIDFNHSKRKSVHREIRVAAEKFPFEEMLKDYASLYFFTSF